ncbi:hypothetical protein DFJ73DRAFT_826312 [Zopfochytrium polystomum]|nr:hypothetical protein DFJ73DRAFT_826312 [Zopfochytrium polystomum]
MKLASLSLLIRLISATASAESQPWPIRWCSEGSLKRVFERNDLSQGTLCEGKKKFKKIGFPLMVRRGTTFPISESKGVNALAIGATDRHVMPALILRSCGL